MKQTLPNFLRTIFCAWLGAVTLEYLLLPEILRPLTGLQGLAAMSGLRVFLVTAFLTILGFLCPPGPRIQRWVILGSFLAYGLAALTASFTWAFLGVCGLVASVLSVYAVHGWRSSVPPPAKIRG